jgi:hypothetical protein
VGEDRGLRRAVNLAEAVNATSAGFNRPADRYRVRSSCSFYRNAGPRKKAARAVTIQAGTRIACAFRCSSKTS